MINNYQPTKTSEKLIIERCGGCGGRGGCGALSMTLVVRVFVSVALDVAGTVGDVLPPFDAASPSAFIEPQSASQIKHFQNQMIFFFF